MSNLEKVEAIYSAWHSLIYAYDKLSPFESDDEHIKTLNKKLVKMRGDIADIAKSYKADLNIEETVEWYKEGGF